MSGNHPAPCFNCSGAALEGKLLCARCSLASRLRDHAARLYAGGFDGVTVALLREAAEAVAS